MADERFGRDVVSDLVDQAAAIRRLAGNEAAFRAVFEAFGAGDAKGFQAALRKARLFPRCELVCEWMRSKHCVLLCHRLCGPPREFDPPDPRVVAEAVVRVTTDPKLASRLAQIVEKGDRPTFQRFIKQHGLTPFCHVFCHWVCTVRFRLVCRWICQPTVLERPNFAAELQTAGHALRHLLERGFDDAVAASDAGDADKFRAVLTRANLIPFCPWLCEWFCSWRCIRVCFTVCREFPLERIADPTQEAFDFGRVVAALQRTPTEIEHLMAALEKNDVKAFAEHVRRLNLERFCFQLCHWLCFVRCRLFCRLCPPVDTIPLFTHVGQYRVDPSYGDFQADGTTTVGDFAFTSTIPLIGILPDATAVDAVEYRFRVAKFPALTPVDVVASMVRPTRIGQLQYWYWNASISTWTVGSAEYWANHPAAPTASIPQQFGPPLTVSVNAIVKPGGWIEVPREDNLVIGGIGRFVRNSDRLVDLDTLQFTDEQFDLRTPAPGLIAGDSVPVASRSEAPTFRIFFQARKVIGGTAVNANQLDTIAFSNTLYTYTRHTEWAGGDVTTRTVCSLDIVELMPPAGTGCDRLENDLHALYTTYHPYLKSVSVFFEGNAPLPPAVAPLIAGGEATSPGGGEFFDISGLAPCAYIVWLHAEVGLTTGYGQIGSATDTDHIAFCKGRRGT